MIDGGVCSSMDMNREQSGFTHAHAEVPSPTDEERPASGDASVGEHSKNPRLTLERYCRALIIAGTAITIGALVFLWAGMGLLPSTNDSGSDVRLALVNVIASVPAFTVFTTMLGAIGVVAIRRSGGWRLCFATGIAALLVDGIALIASVSGAVFFYDGAPLAIVGMCAIAAVAFAFAVLSSRCKAASLPSNHKCPLLSAGQARAVVAILAVAMLIAAAHGVQVALFISNAMKDPLSTVHEGGITGLGWSLTYAEAAGCIALALPGVAGLVAAVRPRWWGCLFGIAYAGLWVIALANIYGALSLHAAPFRPSPLTAVVSYVAMLLPIALMHLAQRLANERPEPR